MKILFIVQGEGRGHLTQAISMERLLRSNGHEVVEVLVGKVNPDDFRDFYPEHPGSCQTVYQPQFPAYPRQQTGKPDTKHLI